jgi:hypothetical protein
MQGKSQVILDYELSISYWYRFNRKQILRCRGRARPWRVGLGQRDQEFSNAPMRGGHTHRFAVVLVRQKFREIVYGIGHCDRTLPHTVCSVAAPAAPWPVPRGTSLSWQPRAPSDHSAQPLQGSPARCAIPLSPRRRRTKLCCTVSPFRTP